MHRRRFLTVAGTGVTVGIAGCSSEENTTNEGDDSGGGGTESPTDEADEQTDGEPASFELRDYTIPEEVQLGNPLAVEVTVVNTGGQSGDFSIPFQIRAPGREWGTAGEATVESVGGGEEAIATNEELIYDHLTELQFRLEGSSDMGVTDFEVIPAQLSWDEAHLTELEDRLQVNEPVLQGAVEARADEDTTFQWEPDSDGQWALVEVQVTNERDSAAYPPRPTNYGLSYNGEQTGPDGVSIELTNYEHYEIDGRVQPGDQMGGYLLYDVPENVTVDELQLTYSVTTSSGEIAADWA